MRDAELIAQATRRECLGHLGWWATDKNQHFLVFWSKHLFPIAAVLWVLWYLLGNPWILVTADIFLIYPMVQVFPLKPLDGSDLWAWSRGAWIGTFIVVMSTFIFMGSEALKNVI